MLWAGGATAAVAEPVAATSPPAPSRYRPPVDAPITDPFRPPPEPWLAGNRGIEYATRPGSAVGAIGPGTVVFAGAVASRLVVTVLHPDGLRSSYVGLAAIAVVDDQRVSGGEPVGVAGWQLHLGVRRGDTYLDPASLWGRPAGGRPVLVPLRPTAAPIRGFPAWADPRLARWPWAS